MYCGPWPLLDAMVDWGSWILQNGVTLKEVKGQFELSSTLLLIIWLWYTLSFVLRSSKWNQLSFGCYAPWKALQAASLGFFRFCWFCVSCRWINWKRSHLHTYRVLVKPLLWVPLSRRLRLSTLSIEWNVWSKLWFHRLLYIGDWHILKSFWKLR